MTSELMVTARKRREAAFISGGAVGQRLLQIFSLMVLAWSFLREVTVSCPEMCWRNQLIRPAPLGPSDTAVEFISTQSPDVAVAMPPRVLRAEKNLVRTGRAEFTLARSPGGEPGRAGVFSRGERAPLGPNESRSRSPTRWGVFAEARRRNDSAARQ